MRTARLLAPVALALALGACASRKVSNPRCEMTGVTRQWIEGSLVAWDDVRYHALRIPHEPPPPLIFFDRYCAYEFTTSARSSLVVRAGEDTLWGIARAHNGQLALANGLSLPIRATAFSSLLPGDSTTFLVMALEDVWRSDPEYRTAREHWPSYLRQAFIHEMTHTRQLGRFVPTLRLAGGRLELVDVDDDIVQQRFDTVPGFTQSVLAETELLFAAARVRGAAQKRDLTTRALRMMRERRSSVYGGVDAPWARLEQLWLDMEGAAQWAVLAHLEQTRPLGGDTRRDIVRGSRQFWSQDQGLALYMVLDELVPDWPSEMFSSDPPSSLTLIERAIAPRP